MHGSTERKGKFFTISHLSALSGVSLRTLRFYEERELLHPRRLGRERLYCEKDIVRLEVILKAKRFGFSLAEIWTLLKSHDQTGRGSKDTATGIGLTQREIELRIEMLTLRRTLVTEAIADLREAMAKEPR